MIPDPARSPGAFVAPLVSALLTLPAAAFSFVGLSPMTCDS
ncbi:hypothetical protein [Streptomyces sp. SID13666]|nr:hypothetical protein [Streptomyces sp. SID13666]